MKFKSTPIKGAGRGKLLGYPTINLKIPNNLEMDYGIYGATIYVDNKKYLGAMHYGPIPTFNDNNPSLEIFLIDTPDIEITESSEILAENLNYLRPIKKFETEKELTDQIADDVIKTKSLLKS